MGRAGVQTPASLPPRGRQAAMNGIYKWDEGAPGVLKNTRNFKRGVGTKQTDQVGPQAKVLAETDSSSLFLMGQAMQRTRCAGVSTLLLSSWNSSCFLNKGPTFSIFTGPCKRWLCSREWINADMNNQMTADGGEHPLLISSATQSSLLQSPRMSPLLELICAAFCCRC